MAFPTAAVLDNFTGTNGTDLPAYSANWSTPTSISPMEIQANAATGTVSGNNAAYWNVSNFGADTEVYYTINTKSGSGAQEGVLARLVQETSGATIDGYYLSLNPAAGTDAVRINRLDNGGVTQLGADISQEVGAGDSLGLEIVGSTLQAYYKASGGSWGALGTSRTDATYSAAGKIGMLASNTATRMDAFGGGTYGGTQSFSYTATGGLSFSGVAGELRNRVLSGAGGLLLAGVADQVRKVAIATAGGLQFAGAAVVAFHESTRTVVASGGLTFGGAASVGFVGEVLNLFSGLIANVGRLLRR